MRIAYFADFSSGVFSHTLRMNNFLSVLKEMRLEGVIGLTPYDSTPKKISGCQMIKTIHGYDSALKEASPDLLIIDEKADYWKPVLDSAEKQNIKVAIVVDISFDSPHAEPILNKYNPYLNQLRRATYYIATQKWVADVLVKYGFSKKKIYILPRKFLDLEEIKTVNRQSKKKVRKKLSDIAGTDLENKVVFGYIGRFLRRKNLDYLLGRENWKNILIDRRNEGIETHLFISGFGAFDEGIKPNVEELKKMYRTLEKKFPGTVTFLEKRFGHKESLEIQRAFDVSCNLSGREYTATLPLESMAVETPVLLLKADFNSIFFRGSYLVEVGGWSYLKEAPWARPE